ncbi:MAG: hypothetical protein Q8R96_01985, partial [Bacteroidota bacterium]|nr:hypothetical protein [Bacteroidota bacterium]
LNSQGKSGSERIMFLFKPDRNPVSTHKFKAGLRNSRALICDSIGCLNIRQLYIREGVACGLFTAWIQW